MLRAAIESPSRARSWPRELSLSSFIAAEEGGRFRIRLRRSYIDELARLLGPEQSAPGYRGGDPDGQQWFNHMSLQDVAAKVGADTFRSCFKFCCVRDPFDKILSAFFWFSPLMKQAGRDEQIATFRTWLDRDALEADWRTALVFDRD